MVENRWKHGGFTIDAAGGFNGLTYVIRSRDSLSGDFNVKWFVIQYGPGVPETISGIWVTFWVTRRSPSALPEIQYCQPSMI